MKETIFQVPVNDIIRSDAALTPTAGDRVYEELIKHLQTDSQTEVDFSGIQYITSAFLHAAIGQLYSQYDSDFLKQHLTITNLQSDDVVLLSRVITRAKEYFSNKEAMEGAFRHVLND